MSLALSLRRVATLALLCLSPPALAQVPDTTTAFQVEIFEPQPAQGVNLLNLAKSDVMQHLYPSAGFFFHYVDDPFELVRQDDTDVVVSRIIENQMRLELWAALGLFDYADIAVVMPLIVSQSGEGGQAPALFGASEAVGGFVVGDLRIIPKFRPFHPADAFGFGVAVSLPLYLPTGDTDTYNSYGALRVKPTLSVDWRHDSGFAVVANLGYMLQPKAQAHNLVLDDGLHWGVGLEIPLGSNDIKILTTLFGVIPSADNVDPSDPDRVLADGRSAPSEFDGAFMARFGPMVLEVGGGVGLNSGVGSPDFRVFLSLGYTPVTYDRDGDGILDRDDDCPDVPEDKDGFEDLDGCPEPDNDKDGVLDLSDGVLDALGFGVCRNDPEDKDGFEDVDGCPDTDNDKDGVLDVSDGQVDASGFGACRNDPEDKDGFEDADGCPDNDNDSDGLRDVVDGPPDGTGFGSCRNDPEDKDLHQDDDGCSDPDNDKDGVADIADGQKDATGYGECRNQPETKNDYADEDGCPDEAPRKVRVTQFQIEILEKVFFDYNKATIQKVSFDLLDEVARVIKETPILTKIRVEGHTDFHGDDAYNLKLSQERAESVMVYLADKGVVRSRLEAKGWGEERPLIPGPAGRTNDGRAKNRRVEFHIIEVNGQPHSPGKPVIIEKTEVVP